MQAKATIKFKGVRYVFDAETYDGKLEDIDIRPACKVDHPLFQVIETEFYNYLDKYATNDTIEMYDEGYYCKRGAVVEAISEISSHMIENNIKVIDLSKSWDSLDIEGLWQG